MTIVTITRFNEAIKQLNRRVTKLSHRVAGAKKGMVNILANQRHYLEFRLPKLKQEAIWKKKYTALASALERYNATYNQLRFVRLNKATLGDQIILKLSGDERLKLKELLKRGKHVRHR